MALEHKERLLRKVKLNNGGGCTVEWKDTYFDAETSQYVNNDESRTSDGVVHEDLTAAMSPLIEHLAIACEMVPEVKGNHGFDGSLKGVEKFKISSVTLRGGEHKEDDDRDPVSVHIFGRKRLKDGRVVNFGTPGIKLGSPQESYRFSTQLDQHVQHVEKEAWAYLEGKVAPPAQRALDFEDHENVAEFEEHAELGDSK